MRQSSYLTIPILAGALLSGCGRTPQRMRNIEANLNLSVPPKNLESYSDEEIALRVPEFWVAEALEQADAKTHVVSIRNAQGLFARVTLVRGAGNARAFTEKVVESLKNGNRTVTAKPHTATLADQEAVGSRYTFKADSSSWVGWVVACESDRGVVCFLGQFPENQEENLTPLLTDVMKSLRLKAGDHAHAATTPNATP